MKRAVYWDVKPYSPVEVYRRFGGALCLHREGKAKKELLRSKQQKDRLFGN
jgi:hypothetical protein